MTNIDLDIDIDIHSCNNQNCFLGERQVVEGVD
jgi:hypothetical protein